MCDFNENPYKNMTKEEIDAESQRLLKLVEEFVKTLDSETKKAQEILSDLQQKIADCKRIRLDLEKQVKNV